VMFSATHTPKEMTVRRREGSNVAFERNEPDTLESHEPLGPSMRKNWNWSPSQVDSACEAAYGSTVTRSSIKSGWWPRIDPSG